MLDYNILDYKAKVTKNKDVYKDLLSKSFEMKTNLKGTLMIVNKYYVARPDLISLAVYGDDKYADIICKVNGISNPFELNEDDLLFLPEIEFITECCKNYGEKSDFVKSEKDNFKNTNVSLQKKKTDKRSPNDQLEGEKNFVIDKSLGLVFY